MLRQVHLKVMKVLRHGDCRPVDWHIGQVLDVLADIHQLDLGVLLELHGLQGLAHTPADLSIQLLIEVRPLGDVAGLVLQLSGEEATLHGIGQLLQHVGVLAGGIPLRFG